MQHSNIPPSPENHPSQSKKHEEYAVAGTGVDGHKFFIARIESAKLVDKLNQINQLSAEEQAEYIRTGKIPKKYTNILIIDAPEEEISEEDYKASIKKLNPGV